MIKLLLVDFDGVLSNGKFYAGYPFEYKNEFEHLQNTLFKNKSPLLTDWMRGHISYQMLHERLAETIGADPAIYDTALVRSVMRMSINSRMLATVNRAREAGIKVALFTDNMDIFDNFSVQYHKLESYFDAIYSSSQHGKLKTEDDSLFTKACKELSAKPNEVALVDDSRNSVEAIEDFGGQTFLYEGYTDSHTAFEAWLFDGL